MDPSPFLPAINSGPLLPFQPGAQDFAEGLPYLMMTLLERRYLSDLKTQNWEVGDQTLGPHRPLLREVVSLGLPGGTAESGRAMPHLLTACHQPGHAFVTVLHGQGKRHRLYIGGRRTADVAAPSTLDYLQGQEGALKAYFGGLEMSASASRLDGKEMPELARLLQTAPALGVITGIPSARSFQKELDLQSIDRVVASAGNHRYALMVIAEPMDPSVVDQTLDACRRLKSEIHGYIQTTISRSRQEGKSETKAEQTAPADDGLLALPTGLSHVTYFLKEIGIPFGKVVHLVTSTVSNLTQATPGNALQIGTSQGTSDSATAQLLNANAQACEALLDQHIKRISAGRSSGWWQTAIYIAAETEAGLQAVSAALRSVGSGDDSSLDPLRLLSFPDYLVRGAIEQGQILKFTPNQGKQSHPLGPVFDSLATCLNSSELSVVTNLPRREIPGVPMREHAEFALSVPAPEPDSVELGTVLDAMDSQLEAVTIPFETLNRHVFITGMTGYGKTTTCKRMLLEAYTRDRNSIPFLVIEPVKTEYRDLARAAALKGKLRIYSLGGKTGPQKGISPAPFRLNPLQIVPRIPLARQIDLLKAVFNASFPMFAGMPYVLEAALHEVYRERGWSLYNEKNPYLSANPTLDEISALTPNLDDLYAKINVVLAERNYGKEVEQNMGAALRARLNSLMMGNKGIILNTRRSTPLEDLFRSPTIIELAELRDDEEKAFVMALLFGLLYEYAELRQQDLPEEHHGRLQHLTVIEEAHRLLQAPRAAASSETADPRGKAVSMFTDMLSEMRAYGEGFIIADQSPTRLVSATLKNTSLKIIHRLSFEDDRRAAGSCMNLDSTQEKFLNRLQRGQAVIHDERMSSAVRVKIRPLPDDFETKVGGETAPSVDRTDKSYLRRHAGCTACPSPCDFYNQVRESGLMATNAAHLEQFLERVLLSDAESAWNAWTTYRGLFKRDPGLTTKETEGQQYCVSAQQTYDWLGKVVARRNLVLGKDTPLTPPDRLHREAGARTLAFLFQEWAKQSALTAGAQKLFAKVQLELRAAITAEPPREFAGCALCPARCLMLPFTAAQVQPLGKSLTDSLLRAGPAEQHLQSIRQLVARASGSLTTDESPEPRSSPWLYCFLTINSLPPIAAARRDEVLELLRK